jgi:hypothetical protein
MSSDAAVAALGDTRLLATTSPRRANPPNCISISLFAARATASRFFSPECYGEVINTVFEKSLTNARSHGWKGGISHAAR